MADIVGSGEADAADAGVIGKPPERGGGMVAAAVDFVLEPGTVAFGTGQNLATSVRYP